MFAWWIPDSLRLGLGWELNALIAAYLPKQLSEEEIATIVRAAVDKVGATSVKDLGKIMKEVSGQVDDAVAPKKFVSDVAKRVLQGSP